MLTIRVTGCPVVEDGFFEHKYYNIYIYIYLHLKIFTTHTKFIDATHGHSQCLTSPATVALAFFIQARGLRQSNTPHNPVTYTIPLHNYPLFKIHCHSDRWSGEFTTPVRLISIRHDLVCTSHWVSDTYSELVVLSHCCGCWQVAYLTLVYMNSSRRRTPICWHSPLHWITSCGHISHQSTAASLLGWSPAPTYVPRLCLCWAGYCPFLSFSVLLNLPVTFGTCTVPDYNSRFLVFYLLSLNCHLSSITVKLLICHAYYI